MSGMTSEAGTAPKSEQAKQAVSTAAQRAGDVASEASDQVRNVAAEAKQQARDVAQHTAEELRQQAQQRSHQVAGNMRTLADRLGSLAEGDPQAAGPLVDYLREGQQRISEWAGRLDEGPDAVLDDLRRFARRKPMVFLASAGALGFIAGRLVRSGAGSSDSSTSPAMSSGSAGAIVAGPATTTPMPYPDDGRSSVAPASTSPTYGDSTQGYPA